MKPQSLVVGYFDSPDHVSVALGALRTGGFEEVDLSVSRDAAACALQVRAGARYREAEEILATHSARLRTTQLSSPFGDEEAVLKPGLPVVPVSEADWLDQHTPARAELAEEDDALKGTAEALRQPLPPGDEADLLDQWTVARRQMHG